MVCLRCFYVKSDINLFGHFWAFVLISAVISILDYFGSLLPARTVTVNRLRENFLEPTLVNFEFCIVLAWIEFFLLAAQILSFQILHLQRLNTIMNLSSALHFAFSVQNEVFGRKWIDFKISKLEIFVLVGLVAKRLFF